MGFGDFLRGVGRSLESIVTNPQFQSAAIGLGTQALGQLINRRSAPPPSVFATGPTLRDVQAAQQRLPTGLRLPPGVIPLQPRMPAMGTPIPGRRAPIGGMRPAGFAAGPAILGGVAGTVLGGLLPEGLQRGGQAVAEGFGGFLGPVGTSGGGVLSEIGERLGGLVTGQPTMFRIGGPRATPVPLLMERNPETGTPTFWKHVGRPILFSGDLATCKRVGRIARRARRVRGSR